MMEKDDKIPVRAPRGHIFLHHHRPDILFARRMMVKIIPVMKKGSNRIGFLKTQLLSVNGTSS